MTDKIKFITISILATVAMLYCEGVSHGSGYISGASFIEHNGKLFLQAMPMGIFVFDPVKSQWETCNDHAGYYDDSFHYLDTLYKNYLFFDKGLESKYNSGDLTALNNTRYTFRRDSLLIIKADSDTTRYSVYKDESLLNYGGEINFNYFDGKNLWFSIWEIYGDADLASCIGCYKPDQNIFRFFSQQDFCIEPRPQVIDYPSPGAYASHGNKVYIGTGTFSDYGVEPYGYGIYIYDIIKDTMINVQIDNKNTSHSIIALYDIGSDLWICTLNEVCLWHTTNNKWHTWTVDSMAEVIDTVLAKFSPYDDTIIISPLYPGDRVQQLGEFARGCYIKSKQNYELWYYDKNDEYGSVQIGDSIKLWRDARLFMTPVTLDIFNVNCSFGYNNAFAQMKILDKSGKWLGLRFDKIWIPFESLKFRLKKNS